MSRLGAQIGLARLAIIKDIDLNRGVVKISIPDANSDIHKSIKEAPIPTSWGGNGVEFSGGYPSINSTVLATQMQGGTWAIANYASFGFSNTVSPISEKRSRMSALKPGRHLIQVKNYIRHIVDPDIGVQAGNQSQYTQINPKLGINSSVSNFNMNFTEASRKIDGPIMRDVNSNSTRNISVSALTSQEYNASLREIGLDPKGKTGDGIVRNPGFVESREIVYEFRDSFGFTNDLEEISIYDKEKLPSDPTFFPRNRSRADVLSLSLISPNQLVETIKGTVVDIYGNILDINRSVIPIGNIDSLSFKNNEQNPSDTFISIRRELRKSLAYHFEINARKDISPDVSNIDSFINSNKDYSRNRSKFSFDIDKEGQFKLNVPSSSEVGNIALPVRAENYSTISSSKNETDPRQFVRNKDNQDIYLDSFGKGVISISSDDSQNLQGAASPVDRITDKPIKLGTVFHDMSKTLILHGIKNPVPLYPASKLNSVPVISKIFSDNIVITGDAANAGGRSGTITLDGHLSMSIGANTIDRQSLWLDCAGGIVSNIGRDKNDISYAGHFDGDVHLEIGGPTINDDSRFTNNEYKPGVFDMRIHTGNMMHILRFDQSGLRIYTPGEIDFASEGHMRLQSKKGNLYLDGKGVYIYANDLGTSRLVLRKAGQSIG